MDVALLTKRIYLRAHGRHRVLQHERDVRMPSHLTLGELRSHNNADIELHTAATLKDGMFIDNR